MVVCARTAEDTISQLARLAVDQATMTPAEVDTVLAHLAEAVAGLPQIAPHLRGILDHARDTHALEMDDMTATTDTNRAIDTARPHLDLLQDPAVATYQHLNAARNEVTYIRAEALDSSSISRPSRDRPRSLPGR